jgi:hypothetical protein
MKLRILAILTCSVASLMFAALQNASSQPKQGTAPKSNPEILSKLEQVVALRQKLVEQHDVLAAAGRAQATDPSPQVALCQARIELARERQQPDVVLAQLREVASVYERLLKWAEERVTDRLESTIVDNLRVGLLEAEIRLLREQNRP